MTTLALMPFPLTLLAWTSHYPPPEGVDAPPSPIVVVVFLVLLVLLVSSSSSSLSTSILSSSWLCPSPWCVSLLLSLSSVSLSSSSFPPLSSHPLGLDLSLVRIPLPILWISHSRLSANHSIPNPLRQPEEIRSIHRTIHTLATIHTALCSPAAEYILYR